MSHPIQLSLPTVSSSSCPGGTLDPLCQIAGAAGSAVVSAGASSVLQSLSSWVVNGATWLLDQIGSVLSATTSVDLGASWFETHYRLMAALGAIVLLPLLVCGILQAVYRQDAAMLVRSVLVHVPLALLLTAVAVQVVQLGLGATDALSNAVSAGSGNDIQRALSSVTGSLTASAGTGGGVPAFVLFLGAVLVAIAAFGLWLELLVRAAAVYVAVLFLPMALASLVWPTVSHWCRRLVDTLVALVLSKFVVVAVLSLAASAVASGTEHGFSSVLAGGALLLLASLTPFTLLRIVPMVEAGAVQQLEGARHRVRQAVESVPRTAASYALGLARKAAWVTGPPGTGLALVAETPGPDVGAGGVAAGDELSTGDTPADDAPGGEGTGGDDGFASGALRSTDGSVAGREPLWRRGWRGRGRRQPSRAPSAPPQSTDQPTLLGIPLVPGDPRTNEAYERAKAEGPPTPQDPLFGGRGPMPWWGGGDSGRALEAPDPVREAQRQETGAEQRRRARMVIERDEVGPVIRWLPDDVAPDSDDAAGRDGGGSERGS